MFLYLIWHIVPVKPDQFLQKGGNRLNQFLVLCWHV